MAFNPRLVPGFRLYGKIRDHFWHSHDEDKLLCLEPEDENFMVNPTEARQLVEMLEKWLRSVNGY